MKLTDQDLRILEFETYEQYLESLIDGKSLQYFGDRENLISLYRTGYRALTKEAFEAQRNFLQVAKDPNTLFSRNIVPKDTLLQELAERERPNRLGLLSTIIYIRCMKNSVEISGYIDYEEGLRRVHRDQQYSNDWRAIFEGRTVLYPTPVDLLYYNAKTDRSWKNNTRNYRILFDPRRGIIFRNMHDRKDIHPDPVASFYGTNTSRTEVPSELYEQAVLYDHVVRKNY
ncbi:cilia- and flagella-associated protein 299-like [Anopheles ziemanni]|uniref:cilia- and flagella-associated protein 299-like n=1 Tax=Anopheles coustani TaxID=139045 RepID=UPI002658F757|nr:cilia- and flagella-associated protein 299-like [Anopheles coustani]XP_058167056.1 cilia- and flagella-associated protein 299-like [Anopheles ziemanni]